MTQNPGKPLVPTDIGWVVYGLVTIIESFSTNIDCSCRDSGKKPKEGMEAILVLIYTGIAKYFSCLDAFMLVKYFDCSV